MLATLLSDTLGHNELPAFVYIQWLWCPGQEPNSISRYCPNGMLQRKFPLNNKSMSWDVFSKMGIPIVMRFLYHNKTSVITKPQAGFLTCNNNTINECHRTTESDIRPANRIKSSLWLTTLLITHWPLKDLDAILKMWFSNLQIFSW